MNQNLETLTSFCLYWHRAPYIHWSHEHKLVVKLFYWPVSIKVRPSNQKPIRGRGPRDYIVWCKGYILDVNCFMFSIICILHHGASNQIASLVKYGYSYAKQQKMFGVLNNSKKPVGFASFRPHLAQWLEASPEWIFFHSNVWQVQNWVTNTCHNVQCLNMEEIGSPPHGINAFSRRY